MSVVMQVIQNKRKQLSEWERRFLFSSRHCGVPQEALNLTLTTDALEEETCV